MKWEPQKLRHHSLKRTRRENSNSNDSLQPRTIYHSHTIALLPTDLKKKYAPTEKSSKIGKLVFLLCVHLIFAARLVISL